LKHPDPNPCGPPLARPETGGSSPAGAAERSARYARLRAAAPAGEPGIAKEEQFTERLLHPHILPGSTAGLEGRLAMIHRREQGEKSVRMLARGVITSIWANGSETGSAMWKNFASALLAHSCSLVPKLTRAQAPAWARTCLRSSASSGEANRHAHHTAAPTAHPAAVIRGVLRQAHPASPGRGNEAELRRQWRSQAGPWERVINQ